MKELFTTIGMLVMTITLVNGQIIKPKYSENTKGITVNQKSISINDLNRLKIPIANANKELLNAAPTKSWSINPKKHFDAHLRLFSLYGIWSEQNWNIAVTPSSGTEITSIREDFGNEPNDNPVSGQWRSIFPIILKFRAAAGGRYLMSLKYVNAHPTESILIGIDSEITEVYFSSGEINHVFVPERSKDLFIYLSPKMVRFRDGRISNFMRSQIHKGITIKKLN